MARKPKPRNPKVKFDELQMYFGEPYKIDLEDTEGSITIYQPTIGNIVKMGEEKFYSSLSVFTTNTTQHRLMLWDMGVDWNTTSDFELFIMLYQSIDDDVSQLLFKLDFSKFEPYTRELNGEKEIVLYS